MTFPEFCHSSDSDGLFSSRFLTSYFEHSDAMIEDALDDFAMYCMGGEL